MFCVIKILTIIFLTIIFFLPCILLNENISNYYANSNSFTQDEYYCEYIIPGCEYLFQGIDIAEFDLRNDIDSRIGFTEDLYEMSCIKHKKRYINQEYDLPDQIHNVFSLDSGELYPLLSEPMFYENVHQFKHDYANQLGLDEVTKGYFSSSNTIKRLQNKMINYSKLFLHLEATVSLYHISMASKRILRKSLTEYFLDYFTNHRHSDHTINNNTQAKYLDLINTFGTHYFTSATFGGVIDCWIELNPIIKYKMTINDIKSNATAIFLNYLFNKKATDGFNRTIDQFFLSNIISYFNVFGGDNTLFNRNLYDKWRKSLFNNPYIITARLQPITDLVIDKIIKEQVKESIDLYLGLKYLQESSRLLKTYLEILPLRIKESIENSLNKIDKASKPGASYQYIINLVNEL